MAEMTQQGYDWLAGERDTYNAAAEQYTASADGVESRIESEVAQVRQNMVNQAAEQRDIAAQMAFKRDLTQTILDDATIVAG